MARTKGIAKTKEIPADKRPVVSGRKKPVVVVEKPKRQRSRRTKGIPIRMKKGRTPGCFRNKGGFLIDPPKDCEWKVFGAEGGVWTDLSLCGRSCQAQCDRYREFSAMKPDERERDLLSRGVKPLKKKYED